MQLIAVALHSSTGASNLPPGNLELLFLRQQIEELEASNRSHDGQTSNGSNLDKTIN
jgi:hypothetical protein